MGQNSFDERVTGRVPKNFKVKLEMLAKARQLDVSDIVREALRQYLERNEAGLEQVELPLARGGRE